MTHGVRSAALALLLAAPASAFVTEGVVWPNGQGPLHVGALSGTDFRTAIARAANEWEDVSDFNFAVILDDVGACQRDFTGAGPLDDGAQFAARDCDGFFLSDDTLAVTQFEADGTQLVNAGVVFNDAFDWHVYDGAWDDAAPDFHRVALHELGHWLGLDHESRFPSILQPVVSDIDSLQPDDVAGVRFLYGPTGPPPPPSSSPLSPEVICQRAELRAAGDLCRKRFACDAALAQDPSQDPGGAKRDACVAKATLHFDQAYAAALAGGACLWSVSPDDAAALVVPPAETLIVGLLTGADPASKPDRKLRRALLQKASRACVDGFADERRYARHGDITRRSADRSLTTARFVDGAQRAVARAAGDGIVYGGTPAEEVGSSIAVLVDSVAAEADGP